MAELTITVNQQLDLCGDEFLNERDFEITFHLSYESTIHVLCTIDGQPNCFIKRSDLLAVLGLLGGK